MEKPTSASNSPDPLEGLIREARAGSREALGKLLGYCRDILLRKGLLEMEPDVQAKGSDSDLVQETLLEAHRDFHQFQGNTREEFLAWLRGILQHNFRNFLRRYRLTDKRQVIREMSLEELLADDQFQECLRDPRPSPEGMAIENESRAAFFRALEWMPPHYRRVILLQQQDCSLEEMGLQMGCSKEAARKLLCRALQRLVQIFKPFSRR